MPIKVFCSYSHQDRDLKKGLEEHLSPLIYSGRIAAYWSDDELTAGREFDPAILGKLEEANLILVLLSASYYHSAYCRDVELRRALERHEEGRARVVLILLRDMMWDVPPINKYSIIPRNLRAVMSWPSTDEAFTEITREIKRVIDEVQEHVAYLTTGATGVVQRPPLDQTAPATSTPISEDPELAVFHCVPRLDDPAVLRSTGITELLPDVILQLRGDPGERRFADLWVYANANITSRIMGPRSLSEATLSLATGFSITGLSILRHNIRAVQGSVGAVAFLHVPLHELRALPQAERNLRIANIRVNAGMLDASLAQSRGVHLYLTISDTTVTPQQLFVAQVEANFYVRIAPADNRVDLARLSRSDPLNAGIFTEQRTAERLTLLVSCTGRLAAHEPPGERTRVRLDVNVPRGVSVFATTEHVSSEPKMLSATLTRTDAFGNGPVQEPLIDGHVRANDRLLALSRIDLHEGTGYATWELDGGSLEGTQEVTLGVVLAYSPDPSQNLPGLGPARATVTLAPAGGPLAGIQTADAIAPIPRFWNTPVSQPLFSIVP